MSFLELERCNEGRRTSDARTRCFLAALLGTTALLAPSRVLAFDIWIGTTSNWYATSNWSLGSVPTSSDQVIIDTGSSSPAQITSGVAHSAGIQIGLSSTTSSTLQIGGNTILTSQGDGGIGSTLGASGTVSVYSGAVWNIDNLDVGGHGTGNLFVTGGAAVNSAIGIIGVQSGSTGTVVVDTGGTWTSSGNLTIGSAGDGRLTIGSGGTVITNVDGIMGANGGGSGFVTVNGGHWVNNGNLTVGSSGNGTLAIQSGGSVQLSSGSGTLSLGQQSAAGGIVTVDGAGSSLHTSGVINIGVGGTGGLSVMNGGFVHSGAAYLGFSSGSSGSVQISDAGSSWVSTGTLNIGYYGQGTVNVLGGATLTSDSIAIAVQASNSANNRLSVDGAGSSVQINNDLVVGYGAFGVLLITNGGTVTAPSSFGTVVGSLAGSAGGIGLLGAGSTLATQALTVGASGSGILQVMSGGTVTVNGGSGNITLAQNAGSTGTLIIGSDPLSPATAPGAINAASITMGAGSAEIDFNHTSANYVFTPGITGGGIIQQIAGVTNLTGNSSGFSGTTSVKGGTFLVNGTLGGTLTVDSGTLGGSGTVGDTTINGGTLAPGNSIGTLTVHGNLVLTAAATYLVEVSPASADRTNVTGTATLGGATVNAVFAAGSYVTKQYTIVNATGGVSGTFATLVNTNLPSGFTSGLSYDATNAYLNLTLSFALPSSSGLNLNQQNVASAITNFFNAGGNVPIAFGGLTPAGLTQLSGELATGSQQSTFNAMGLFLGLLTDPITRGGGQTIAAGPAGFAKEAGEGTKLRPADAFAMALNPTSRALFEQRWSTWASAYGGAQATDGRSAIGSNDASSRIFGAAVGADYLFSPNTFAGFAIAGGGTNFAVTGAGTGRSDLFQAGAYLRHNNGPAYVSAALAYGWQDVTTDRTVTIAGVDHLQANFRANAYSGRVEGGYRVIAPWTGGIGITPYAAAQATMFDLPGYAETVLVGTGTSALTYAAKSVTDGRVEFGARTDKSFVTQDGVLTLRGRFAWAHDFNPDRSVAATFQALPGASFVVNGAAQAADAALITASAEKKWLNGWSAAATFEGEFSEVTRSYAGKGVVRYQW